MANQQCSLIGSFSGEPKEFVTFAASCDLDGSCQGVPVGRCENPTPVLDGETLARQVHSPTHLDKGKSIGDAEIDETLFLDAFSIGGSVTRIRCDWNTEIIHVHKAGEQRAESLRKGEDGRPPNPNRLYLGAVRLGALEVRATDKDKKKRVRLYDTSKKGDENHADIVVAVSGNEDKTWRKAIRVALLMAAQKYGLYVSPHLNPEIDLSKIGMQLIQPAQSV